MRVPQIPTGLVLSVKYFGNLGSLDDRLSQDEREELDGFVHLKMKQAGGKSLDGRMLYDKLIDL